MTIDVIEALDGAADEMVRRVPPSGSGEFKLGAQVIVRESQTGVFFRDGKCYDAFGAGRHTLSTLNMPLMSGRVTDRVFGESPFKAEVYFVNHRVFLGVKWGTRDPITYRDKELSVVRLRAHGEMALRVSDPVLFVNKVVGTQGVYTTREVQGFMKSLAVSALAQTVGSLLESIFDLAVRYDELATATKARVFEEFAAYGTELVDFVIESITPPEEVQARIDERSGMSAIGDLDNYLRYKSALAISEAASNPGGGAGGALDAATGLGLGMAVMRSAQEGTAVPASIPTGGGGLPTTISCSVCAKAVPAGSKFCPECGAGVVANLCSNCKQPLTTNAKFCANCGTATSPGRA
jgi:membrane protease subunit (stomatin/prohibitin family)